MQDVTAQTFVEIESGLTCRLDRYYIMSDAGGMYLREDGRPAQDGFETIEDAIAWSKTLQAKTTWGDDFTVVVPTFNEATCEWDGIDAANVMLGKDLKKFQEYTLPH